jgi:hypothetical protein
LRVIALLAAHNEERFIVPCLDTRTPRAEVCVIDNESEDGTVALARRFLGRGLVGVETFPRGGVYRWQMILQRKEQLAATLDADWFMHADPDEVRLPPQSGATLAAAFAEADREGFNAVNFIEFTFVPTGSRRTTTTRTTCGPCAGTTLSARLPEPGQRLEEATGAGGRLVGAPGPLPGLRMPGVLPDATLPLPQQGHAVRKYVQQAYDPEELARGWHTARSRLRAEEIVLQDDAALRRYASDDLLDASCPLRQHPVFALHESVKGTEPT